MADFEGATFVAFSDLSGFKNMVRGKAEQAYRAPGCLYSSFRQIVLAHRREDLHSYGILQDLRPMLHAAGDAPTVPRPGIVLLGTDPQANPPSYEVTGLFVGVRVHWQRAALLEHELGHERPRAIADGLHPDSRQCRLVSF